MGKSKTDKYMLTNFIINNIEAHPKDITTIAASEFKISRQTVYRHMKELISQEIIETSGEKRIKQYKLHNTAEQFCLIIDGSWDEESVWQQRIRSLIDDLPANILQICHYGVTEMVNNVLDHSEASTMCITINLNKKAVEFRILDDGVGIFTKIQRDFNLSDKRHAILELAKGKLTSAPEKHTGEGIFFTSKMFDIFAIVSEDLAFIDFEKNGYLFPDRQSNIEGTLVIMEINRASETTTQDVFNRFSPDIESEDFGFKKTIVPVKLLQYEGDSLISRSQAKRLIARFDHFKEVVLDFEGVNFIGQAFADEVFRVFQNSFPGTHLHTINTNNDIEKMIKHVTANKL